MLAGGGSGGGEAPPSPLAGGRGPRIGLGWGGRLC